MTEREFEEFWQTVDSRHRGLSPAKQLRRRAEEQARAHAQVVEPTLDDDGVAGPANPQSTAAAKSAKTARCGSCEACRAKDCGECSQSWLRRVWVCCAGGGGGGGWVALSRGPTDLGCHSAWADRTDTPYVIFELTSLFFSLRVRRQELPRQTQVKTLPACPMGPPRLRFGPLCPLLPIAALSTAPSPQPTVALRPACAMRFSSPLRFP